MGVWQGSVAERIEQGPVETVGRSNDEPPLRRQICQRVTDAQVSAQDKQVLSGLVSSAESRGIPVEIMTPLCQIADSGAQVPVEAASKLKRACISAPTSAISRRW